MSVPVDRQFQHFVVVELGFEVFAVGEKVEQFERGLIGLVYAFRHGRIEQLLEEVVFPGTASLDLDEVGGREDGAEQAQIQDIRAIVPGGHHTDRHANPRFTRPIRRGGSCPSRAGCCY